jgi:osmotically-inducible protein OsmY
MKTDAQLKSDVENELAWDPEVRSSAIGVAVRDGVVTLCGHIETYPEKRAVEKALRRVAGIKALALELDVRLSPQHRRSDTDLAQDAETALKRHALVSTEAIRVTVDEGRITLNGEVDWAFQRESAEIALRHLVGLVGIANDITIRRRVVPADVVQRIREALVRQAVREAKHIDIEVNDAKVWLRGTVHSEHEREAAQGAAWSAPGVRAVINELQVA